MRTIIIAIVAVLWAATVVAEDAPGNFGQRGQAWQYRNEYGVDYYQHNRNPDLRKNWDAAGGPRFSQPGRAEGRANDSSVIPNDPIHPGTQVLPGSNR